VSNGARFLASSASDADLKDMRLNTTSLAVILASLLFPMAALGVTSTSTTTQPRVSAAKSAARSTRLKFRTSSFKATVGVDAMTGTNPFLGESLYNDPDTTAAAAVAAYPSDASTIAVLAKTPQAQWFGDWDGIDEVQSAVNTYVTAAASASALPVLVAYSIPLQSCSATGGGEPTAAAYEQWINQFSDGLGNSKAVVIVEPDALSEMSCLSADDQTTRLDLMNYAVNSISADPNVSIFLDAGTAGWVPAATMANLLEDAGISKVAGFSLNVSNFVATPLVDAYGDEISALTGGANYIVDTSRNGLGAYTGPNESCNPPGRAIGLYPTTDTGDAHADAYLWVKHPGESDGACHPGDPASGWFESYAVGLVKDAIGLDLTTPGTPDTTTTPPTTSTSTSTTSGASGNPTTSSTSGASGASGSAGPNTTKTKKHGSGTAVAVANLRRSPAIVLGRSGRLVIGSISHGASRRGRLKWTGFTSSSARGMGTVWRRTGRHAAVSRAGNATILAARPSHGRFTRLTTTLRGGKRVSVHRWRLIRVGKRTWWEKIPRA